MKGERKTKVATRDRAKSSRKPAASATGDSAIFGNLGEVKELIDLVIKKGIAELEIERAGTRVKIARHAAPSGIVTAGPAPAHVDVVSAAPAPKSVEDLVVVRSPMVGTFYAAPSQGAPPFVSAGDRIQSGQVLCIIEAMKLMNEIEAEAAGEIVGCHVENGQPVEYGQALFDIRPILSAKK